MYIYMCVSLRDCVLHCMTTASLSTSIATVSVTHYSRMVFVFLTIVLNTTIHMYKCTRCVEVHNMIHRPCKKNVICHSRKNTAKSLTYIVMSR